MSTNLKRFQKCICETVMKNRPIFLSVAQLLRFEAVRTRFNLKGQSKINTTVCSTNIMLSRKRIDKAGYQ